MEIRTRQISKKEIDPKLLNEKYNNYNEYDTVALEVVFVKDNCITRRVIVFSEETNVI